MVPRPHPNLERPTHVRYWVIVFAVTLAVITYIDRVCISFAAPAIRDELHLSAKQLGWVFLIFNWSYAVFEIPGGFLGDRIGPRKVLMRIVIWWSFFTAATGWAWNYGSLLVTRFMFGAGEAGCFPESDESLHHLAARKGAGARAGNHVAQRAVGRRVHAAAGGAGDVAGSPATAHPEYGWRPAFTVFGCLGVVWAVVFYTWFRDNPFDKPKMNAAERALIAKDGVSATAMSTCPWGKLLASRQVWMLCWQYFCLSYGWYFYVTWLPTYLKEARHLDLADMALLSIWPLFAGRIGQPGFGIRREQACTNDGQHRPVAPHYRVRRVHGRQRVSGLLDHLQQPHLRGGCDRDGQLLQ